MDRSIWPPAGLEVRTPRLRLRYVTDEIGTELAELAAEGIHDPEATPFLFPWTDVAPPQLQRNTMQFYWQRRAALGPDAWNLDLAVEVDGQIVGLTDLGADRFAETGDVVTGSWLGRRFQGLGIGTEMRLATIALGFDGLGAQRALTEAWHDNHASLGVTRKLGYTETGRRQQLRRDDSDETVEFTMHREHYFHVRRDDITFHGVEAVRDLLGIAN